MNSLRMRSKISSADAGVQLGDRHSTMASYEPSALKSSARILHIGTTGSASPCSGSSPPLDQCCRSCSMVAALSWRPLGSSLM